MIDESRRGPATGSYTAAGSYTGTGGVVPAGWYVDPEAGDPTSHRQRFWDGTRWTSHVRSSDAPPGPAGPGVRPGDVILPGVPAGTPVYTPYIWIVTLLPLLSMALRPWAPGGPYSTVPLPAETGMRLLLPADPLGLTAAIVGTLGWIAGIVLAWLDHRVLLSRGFVRPFGWGWAIIPAPVYAIGRSVIARRRSGRGIAPMWVSIGILVVGSIVSTVLSQVR